MFAINGHNGPAAALVAVSLMTKPQALPFILPFAAWFFATRRLARTRADGAIGLGVIVVLWLPFIPAGGPVGYLGNLADYQSGDLRHPVPAGLERLVARPGARRRAGRSSRTMSRSWGR